VGRPRLLLVPSFSRFEWPTLPLIEEWADVAVVDAAWTEDGSAVRHAVAEAEARGWRKAVVVCDEWAIWKAIEIADLRPDLVQAFVYGHGSIRMARRGEKPTLNPEVVKTYTTLLRTDFRMYARALTQTTRGDYDDAQVEAFLSDTTHEEAVQVFDRGEARDGESFAPTLRALGVPLLFGHHTECLLWTDDGFEEAKAEFPDAKTVAVRAKPSASPEFAEFLREFCEGLPES
jgi:hypothetical protein